MKRAALVAAGALLISAAPPPRLAVTIEPQPIAGEERGAVAVTIAVDMWQAATGQPLFRLGVMAPGMPSPQPVEDFRLTDAAGPVAVQSSMADGTLTWRAARAITGPITASYRLPVDNSRTSSPPVALRIDGDAISAPGRALIAVPQIPSAATSLSWQLAERAQGVSSWGDGNVDLGTVAPARLGDGLFMGGHLQRFEDGAFAAVWGGQPPFDPRPPMRWVARLHHWMSRFWGDTAEPPYRVFLRANPANPGGGAALLHSFVVGYGPETTGESLTAIFGHEMTHTWTADEALGKWYSEGNAVFYQSRLPWLAGLSSTETYLADINLTASRYYTNPMRATPEADVLAKFWDDTRIRVLPYDRGALYFAALDGMVRRTSKGRRSIDDLIRTMNARRAAGDALSEADWLALIAREGGPAAARLHRTMMAGGLVLPESGDFGPCFRRTTRPIRQFEIGFAMSSLLGKRIVGGLVPGSNAAIAGVRDGDRIVSFTAGDAVQRDVTRSAVLSVMRNGQPLRFTYLPRGKAVAAYQWERVGKISDERCRTATGGGIKPVSGV